MPRILTSSKGQTLIAAVIGILFVWWKIPDAEAQANHVAELVMGLIVALTTIYHLATAHEDANKTAKAILFIMLMPLSLGLTACGVDEKIDIVDQDWYNAGKAFAVAGKTFQAKADTNEDARNSLRIADIKRKTKEFIATHSDAEGRLTNNPAPGQPAKGLLAADLVKLLDERDEMLIAAAQEHKTWVQVSQLWTEALSKFEAANDILHDKKADWLEKKKSAAAAANTALGVLSTLGGGIAIGALAL